MSVFRKIRRWCPQPKTPLTTKLKHYTLPITVLLTATLITVSFTMFSSTYLFNQPAPQLPVVNTPAGTSNSNFTVPPALQWDAVYGGDAYYSGSAVVQTSDGGYLVAGKLDSRYTADNVILVKVDSNGKMQWNITYSYLGDVFTLLPTCDDEFIMLADGNDPEQPAFLLVKIDSQGSVQWKRTYTQWYNEWGDSVSSMAKTNDGGYIIAGTKQRDEIILNEIGHPVSCGFLIKTDSSGNVQWHQTYGEPQRNNVFSSVVQSSDGGFVIAGATNFNRTSDSYDLNYWLVKTDSKGNLLWDKTFRNSVTGVNQAQCIVQTNDNGYVLAGNSFASDSGNSDIWLVKTDSAGSMLWNHTYAGTGFITVPDGAGGNITFGSDGSGNEIVTSLSPTTDGGLAFVGNTPEIGFGSSLAWLVKLDASGVVQWNQTYADKPMGGNGWTANSLIETTDGGFALAGTWEFTGSVAYYYLAKTEPALPPPTSTPTSIEPQQASQLEIILIVTIVVTVLAVGLGLLIYLIKRK